jgi:hypothetical protein
VWGEGVLPAHRRRWPLPLFHGSVPAEVRVTGAATRHRDGGHHTPGRLPHAAVCAMEPEVRRERERRGGASGEREKVDL